MKTKYFDIVTFFLGALVIGISFFLAYLPLDPATLPPAYVSGFSVQEDPSGTMTREQAVAKQGAFIPSPKPTLFKKISGSAFWIRCTIDIPPTGRENRFLEIDNANLEEISVYFPNQAPVLAGKKIQSRYIPIKTRIWNIPVPDALGTTEPVYIRVRTSSIVKAPLRIVSAATVVQNTMKDTLVFGVFFGILFSVLCVNLFAFVIMKNRLFLYYLFYLLSITAYHLRVHGFLYFLPVSFSALNTTLWLSLCGFGVFMILFSKQFLNLKKRLPVINIVLDVFIAGFLLQTVAGIWFDPVFANRIAYVTGLFLPVVIIASTIKLYLSGHREVRFYLLAWVALFIGTIIWSTAAYLESQFPANYFFIGGTTLDALLLTLAIFDQIRKEMRERSELEEREKYYIDLSQTDALTGLYNRRYLDELVHRIETEEGFPEQSSLIMLDLDNFKTINDTLGHPVGDKILIHVAGVIKKFIRKTDVACRYGGDEFLVFLPGANGATARAIGEQIRASICSGCCPEEGEEPVEVTVSLGVTESRVSDSFDGCLLRADAALYKAKKDGRNCISLLMVMDTAIGNF
jgi:diguanylate cyclase (GGDEF)-like protein